MKSHTIRWLLLVPAAACAWLFVFVCGVLAYSSIDGLCPPADVVSGFCTNDTVQAALTALEHFAVAISAVAVLVAAVAVAPSHKTGAVWASLLAGTVVAIFLALATDALSLLAAALIGGIVATAAITRQLRRRAASNSFQETQRGAVEMPVIKDGEAT